MSVAGVKAAVCFTFGVPVRESSKVAKLPFAKVVSGPVFGRQFFVVMSQFPFVAPSQVSDGVDGPPVKTISMELFATLFVK